MLSSLEDIASVKLAVEMCAGHRLKKEILAAPRTDSFSRYDAAVKQWTENVEKEATLIQNDTLPVTLKKKIIELVPAIARRMLIWAYYHGYVLGFSRENSLNFLNSTHFSQQGIVDHKKAAEELMKGSILNIQQKYRLACLYCLEDEIAVLHKEMIEKFGEDFSAAHEFQKIELIKFWSDCLSGKTRSIEQGENGFEKLRFEIALKSGSKPAVEFCISRSNFEAHLMTGALTTMYWSLRCNYYDCKLFERWDWINGMTFFSVPSDLHMDIFSYLLSRLGNKQLLRFLKKDIRGRRYCDYCEMPYRTSVLDCFLNWPHQDQFMEKAKLMWKFLPRKNYAALLLNICDKIVNWKEDRYDGSARGNYDYRRLLREFWCQSPESHKKYVLSNHEINYFEKSLETLLVKLLTMETFTCEDKENLEIILSGTTNVEKENVSYTAMKSICSQLIKNEKWRLMEWVELNCFSSKEKAEIFKKQFIFELDAKHIFTDFVKGGRWNAVELFLTWSSLQGCIVGEVTTLYIAEKFLSPYFTTEEEINDFKKKVIFKFHKYGAPINLFISTGRYSEAEEFFAWMTLSEEDIHLLKVLTLVSDSGMEKMCKLLRGITSDLSADRALKEWEKIERYLKWSLENEVELIDFEIDFDLKHGFSSHEYNNTNDNIQEGVLNEFYSLLNKLHCLHQDAE